MAQVVDTGKVSAKDWYDRNIDITYVFTLIIREFQDDLTMTVNKDSTGPVWKLNNPTQQEW